MESAEPAAVRVAVMYVPSMSAVSAPRSGIEDGDRRLVRRQLRARVALEERHELRLEQVGRREVGRHHAEQPVAGEGSDALRHRRPPRAEVLECLGQGVHERIEIEQRLTSSRDKTNITKRTCLGLVYTGQLNRMGHVLVLSTGPTRVTDTFFSQASACWFHGTRCVTPAFCIRERFATYQS